MKEQTRSCGTCYWFDEHWCDQMDEERFSDSVACGCYQSAAEVATRAKKESKRER